MKISKGKVYKGLTYQRVGTPRHTAALDPL